MKVVVKSDKEMKGYWGMNRPAAKELHFKPVPKDNEIFISDKLHGHYKRRVIAHEEIERYNMEHRHMKYKEADKIAGKFDKKVF